MSPWQKLPRSFCLPSSLSGKAQQVGPYSGPRHPRAKAGKDSNKAEHNSATAINAEVQDLVQGSEAAKEKPLPAQGPAPNSPAAPNPPTRNPAAPPTLEAADAALKSDAKVEAHGSGEALLSVMGRVVSAQGSPGNSALQRQRGNNASHQHILKAAAEQDAAAAAPQPWDDGILDQPAGQLDAIKGSCPVGESMQPQAGSLGRKGGAPPATFSPSADAHAGLLADSKLTTTKNVEMKMQTAKTDSPLQTAAVDAAAESSPGTPVLERRKGSLGELPSAQAADTVCELEIDLSLGPSPPGDASTKSQHPSQTLLATRPTAPSIPGSASYLNPQSLPETSAVAQPESRQRGINKLDSSEALRSVEPRPRDQPQHQPQSNSGNMDAAAASESLAKDARNEGQGGLKDGKNQQQAQWGRGGAVGRFLCIWASSVDGKAAAIATPTSGASCGGRSAASAVQLLRPARRIASLRGPCSRLSRHALTLRDAQLVETRRHRQPLQKTS